MSEQKPPMPPGWTAKRRADIQHHVDYHTSATPQETRTMLIELLAQLTASEERAAGLKQELAEQEAEKLSLIRRAAGYRLAMECYLKAPGDPTPLSFIRQLVESMEESDEPGPCLHDCTTCQKGERENAQPEELWPSDPRKRQSYDEYHSACVKSGSTRVSKKNWEKYQKLSAATPGEGKEGDRG